MGFQHILAGTNCPTSMAVAYVSRLVDLYMEQLPDKSATEIWELLENKAWP